MKKRPDGRYCKQVLIGYDTNGKRKMKNIYGKTIKEVEKRERELKEQIEDGTILIQEEITVKEWGTQWFNVYKNNVSRNTRSMYLNSLNNYIIPNLGNIPMAKLKPIQIQKVLNNILNSGHIRTGEIFKLTIKQIVSQAVIEGVISKNICDNLEKIKSNRQEKRTLTDFEIRCIDETKTYTPRERLFLNTLYYTGLRRGEALALTVKDIDKKNKKIQINKSLDISENTSEIKSPKTNAGYREVPIPNVLYEELINYINKNNSFYLFPNSKGNMVSRSSYRKMWDSIMKKTLKTARDIEEKELSNGIMRLEKDTSITFTPHIFRHTYATNLYYAGVDVKKSQYLLGHSSIEMTLKIYTHLDNKRNDQEDSNRINNFFSQSKISQNSKMSIVL